VLYLFFIHWIGWNENSRFNLVKAILEGTFQIDAYKNNTGDRAYYNNHFYSDKPPGAAFLATPFLWAWKFMYNHFFDLLKEEHFKEKEYLITWSRGEVSTLDYVNLDLFTSVSMLVVTLFTSSIFGALSVVIIYKILSALNENKNRLLLALTYGLATPILPYSILFFGNVLPLFLGLLSFYLIFASRKTGKNFFLAGLVIGFSIVCDFSMILIYIGLFILSLHYSRKLSKFLLFGSLIGIFPLLIYNFVILGNPFDTLMFHMDPSVWSDFKRKPSFELNLGRLISTPKEILFSPFRGLFFYYPILLFSLIGFFYMHKKYSFETKIIIFMFILFILLNSALKGWFGGSSFGPRYLLPIIPFLILPLRFAVEKAKKNRISFSFFILLLAISIFHNIIGLEEIEGPVIVYNFEAKKYEVLRVVTNPLYEHYFPLFLKNGPRSRILEGLFYNPYKIDIRDFKPMPIREIKLFTLQPFGILVLKIPFLVIPILLLIIVLIWKKELFKTFVCKKISVGFILLILAVLLFLSRLGFKNVAYDKNWYPIYVNATHEIKERWMSQEASIFLYSPKEEKANLLLRIGTFYKPRQLIIEVNDKAFVYFVASHSETLITYNVPLKKGENKINFKSLSGCDKPALLLNGSSDYRCLSFIIHDLSIAFPPEHKIIFGKNWYPPEPYITWAYENSTILIYFAKRAEAKLNLTLISYYKPREIDFYVNNFMLDTFRVEPYKMNILTKTFPLREGENVIKFIPKEKCDIPAIVEKSNDTRCLTFGLFDISFVSPYELMEENKAFFGPNWYEQEKDGRWMSNNASIFLFSEKEKEVSLILELASYYKPRVINLYLNKDLILSQTIPIYRTVITIQKLKLLEGENLIEFKSSESCDIPHAIEKTEDKRCLSFKLFNLKIV
jgi:hypothetical protein